MVNDGLYSSSSQSHERKSWHWGPDGRALASRRRFHVCHLVTLQSLFSIRKRKAPSRKRRSHERERATHTHTARGKEKKHGRQNGFHSHSGRRPQVPYFPPHSVVLFISSPLSSLLLDMRWRGASSDHIKRCLHLLHESL